MIRTITQNHGSITFAGIPPVRMAVNLWARQLRQKDFPETVLRILEETRLQSKWLELELTETAPMDSLDQCRQCSKSSWRAA